MTTQNKEIEVGLDRHVYPALLWSALAGPVVWSLYFLIGYGYIEVACRTPVSGLPRWLYAISVPVVIGLTLLSTLAIVYAGWLAYRHWQMVKADRPPSTAYDPDERNRFLALLGIQSCLLFGLLTAMTGTAALVLDVCF